MLPGHRRRQHEPCLRVSFDKSMRTFVIMNPLCEIKSLCNKCALHAELGCDRPSGLVSIPATSSEQHAASPRALHVCVHAVGHATVRRTDPPSSPTASAMSCNTASQRRSLTLIPVGGMAGTFTSYSTRFLNLANCLVVKVGTYRHAITSAWPEKSCKKALS